MSASAIGVDDVAVEVTASGAGPASGTASAQMQPSMSVRSTRVTQQLRRTHASMRASIAAVAPEIETVSQITPTIFPMRQSMCVHVPKTSVDALTLPEGPTTCCKELSFMARICFPVGVAHQSRLFQIMCLFAACGQIGTVEQAAVANASTWCVTFDCLLFANFAQMSMLVSAALGNENKVLVGIWLQIFMMFNTCLGFLTLGMRFIAVPLFKQIGSSPLVTSAMQSYILYNIPAMFFEMWYAGLREWYTVRAIVWPELVVEIIFGIAAFPTYTFFVSHMDMGLVGISVSQATLVGSKLLLYVVLTWAFNCHKDCWGGISWEEIFVRRRWVELMKGTVPAMMSSLIDGFQFKIMSFVGAGQGNSQAIVAQLVMQLMLVPALAALPMADALGMRVGLYLGMSKIREARFSCFVGLVSCFGFLIVLGLVLALLMHPLARSLSEDPLVVEMLMEVRWASAMTAMSMIAVPCIVVLIKQGRVALVCCSMMMTFIAMVPLYFLMASLGFSVLGSLIFAQSGSFVVLAALHVWNIWRTDWEACAQNSRRMAEVSMRQMSSDTSEVSSPMSAASEAKMGSMGSNAVDAGSVEDFLPVILSSHPCAKEKIQDVQHACI